MQFSLTSCTRFSMPSKHLEVLSIQIAHHTEAGIILNLVLSFARALASYQLYKASVTLPGIVQDMPLRLKKVLQSY